MILGSPDSPEASARRSDQRPAQATALVVGMGPCDVSTIVARPLRERRSTVTPVWISAPAAWISAAMVRATAAKSMMPVSGEWRAATPTAWGSISRRPDASRRLEAWDAVLAASAFEFVELPDLCLVEGDDQLAAALVRRSRARRSTRRGPRGRPCRAGPSASRGRSRCPRG